MLGTLEGGHRRQWGAVGGAGGWSLVALPGGHRRPLGALGGARGSSLVALGGANRWPLGALDGARGGALEALGGEDGHPLGALGGVRVWQLGALVVELRLAVVVIRAVSFSSPIVVGGVSAHLFRLGGASGGGVATLGWSPAFFLGALEWTSVFVLGTMGRSTFGFVVSVDGTLCDSVGSSGGQRGGC